MSEDSKNEKNPKAKVEKLFAYQYGERIGLQKVQVRALRIKYKNKLMPSKYWQKELNKKFNL